MITIRSNRSSSSTTGTGGKQQPQQQQQQTTTVAPTVTTTTTTTTNGQTPSQSMMNGQTDRRNNHHHYDEHYYGYGDKKSKYGHNKNRSGSKHIPHEFVMLQRPTILVKPAVANEPQTEPLNRRNVVEVKDENLKPLDATITTTTTTSQTINGTKMKPTTELKNLDVNHKNALTINKNGVNLTPQSVVLNPITPPLVKQQQHPVSRDLHSKVEESKQAPVVSVSAPMKSVNGSVKSFLESINNRLSTLPYMTHSVKLLDENLQWHDSLGEYLQDQADFLVVGFLGKTGTGKSSLASLLAGGTLGKKDTFVFADNSNDLAAHHRTSGVNAFVTTERTIFLDVQPLLSCSILDRAISGSSDAKKHQNVDFKYFENYIELQSIELACFVLSVCNVVILADDWFLDPNLFRLLHTAEMLLPNLNTPTSGGSSWAQSLLAGEEANSHFEHHPHLIYLLNKCEYINRRDVLHMKSLINVLMTNSKLMYKGSINDLTLMNNSSLGGGHMTLNRPPGNHNNKSKRNVKNANGAESANAEAVNLVLMPKFDADKRANENDLNAIEFNGLPSVEKSVNVLLREILAVRRTNCSFITTNGSNGNSAASASTNNNPSRGQILTEKKWFMYANKVWDTIRKSPFMAEYNRLMT